MLKRFLPLVGFGLLMAFGSALATGESAAPPLRFVTAPPASEVKLTIEQPAFEHELVIEATQAIKDARVEATDLVGPERVTLGCTVAGQLCGTPLAIDAGGAKTLRLAARVEAVGGYSAVISVTAAAVRQNFLLTVTRSPAPFPVELAASVPGASARGGVVSLHIPLQEKIGRATVLNLPALTLTRREAGKTAAEAASFSASMKVAGTAVGASWPVGARQAPVLQLNVEDLDRAGEYSGRLRITSPASSQTLDVPITITQSDSACLAAGLIALGALASFALRTYLRSARPRLVQQRAAAVLAVDLERLRNELNSRFAPLQPVETAVVSGLSDRLTSIGEQLELHTEAETKAVLDEVDAKLSLVRRWVNARRRAASLAELPAEARSALVKVGEFLERPGAKDTTAIDTELKAAEEKIDAAAAAEARMRVEALGQAITASTYLDDATRARLLPAVQAAGSIVDAAEQRAQLDRLEGELVDAQIEGLAHRIDPTQAAPIGFDAAGWDALAKDLRARLDAARLAPLTERSALFRAAVSLYLERLRAALQARLKTHQQRIDQHASLSDAEKSRLGAVVQSLLDKLDPVAASLKAGKLDEAATSLGELGQQVAALQAELGSKGLLSASAAAAEAAPVPAGLDLGASAAALLAGLGLRSRRISGNAPAGWSALIGRLDLLVFGVALAVSVLLGLKLLWVDNATWGSANDYVVALLWGLGLHQISNAAFEGIGGVMDKFTK